MFCLLFCLLWVQLLASDEINERPKFSPKNIIEMGETRSNPMKSFDTSVARAILISTEDSVEPDANSTSDEELTTRSGGMSRIKKWFTAPRSPKPPKEEQRGKCQRRCKKAAKILFGCCFCCCLNLLCPDDDQVDRAHGRPPRPRT